MKLITFDDIQKLGIAPATCYAWVDEMIRRKGEASLPPKIHLTPRDDVFCNVMPCLIPTGSGLRGGVKVVTRYPERVPALDSRLLLLDAQTGEFLALMDANWITAMRTGAVAAHSIVHLAKKDFSVMGMFGLGNVTRATLLVLAQMMPGRELTIKLLRYKGHEEDFARRFAGYPQIHFVPVDDYGTLVRGSDVIVSGATYLENDICPDDAYDEGVLVVPIHTRGFMNCDLFFDKIFADDTGHVCNFRYFDRYKSFAEVSDVVNGKAAGRETDKERILAYNIGVSTHDIFFASRIYEMVKGNPDLMEIEMNTPTEKFWI